MIESFKSKCSEDIFHGSNTKAARKLPRHLHSIAREKLDILNAAQELTDLKAPPGNHLERLRGNLLGKYSIRINNQWRLVFAWHQGRAKEVEIIDYH